MPKLTYKRTQKQQMRKLPNHYSKQKHPNKNTLPKPTQLPKTLQKEKPSNQPKVITIKLKPLIKNK